MIDLISDLFLSIEDFKTIYELLKRCAWVSNNRLHGIDRFERIINADRIVNFKVRLMNIRAKSCCTTKHLLKENTRLHTTHKDQRRNLRHIDSRCKQIDRYGYAGIAFVLKAFNRFLDFLFISPTNTSGNFHNCIVVHAGLGIDFLEDGDNHIRVLIIYGVDKSLALLAWSFRVYITSYLFQHCAVKLFRDYLLIEGINVKVQFIFQQLAIRDLAGHWVIDRNNIAILVVNSFTAELRFQLVRSVMIYKIAFDNSFTVGILKHRLTKNFSSLQCRSCGQRNLHSVKVLNNRAILALIVCLITIKQLIVTHFFVENIAAMRFINDNQVIVGDCRHRIFRIVQEVLYHALNRCYLNTGLLINNPVFKLLDVINVIKGHEFFKFYLFEHILSLLSKRCSIYQE